MNVTKTERSVDSLSMRGNDGTTQIHPVHGLQGGSAKQTEQNIKSSCSLACHLSLQFGELNRPRRCAFASRLTASTCSCTRITVSGESQDAKHRLTDDRRLFCVDRRLKVMLVGEVSPSRSASRMDHRARCAGCRNRAAEDQQCRNWNRIASIVILSGAKLLFTMEPFFTELHQGIPDEVWKGKEAFETPPPPLTCHESARRDDVRAKC